MKQKQRLKGKDREGENKRAREANERQKTIPRSRRRDGYTIFPINSDRFYRIVRLGGANENNFSACLKIVRTRLKSFRERLFSFEHIQFFRSDTSD